VTAIVIAMILIVVVALVVVSVFSEDDDDWSRTRPGAKAPDEGSLDDLLD
jgi:cytochrome b